MPFQAGRGTSRSELARFLIQSHLKTKNKKFSAGEVLFEENTEALGCHVIRRGTVELSVVCLDGSHAAVERVRAGGLVGVSAGFVRCRYVFTARALSDTKTIYIPRKEVLQLFRRHPEIRMLIIHSLSRSVKQAIRYLMQWQPRCLPS